MQLAKQGTLGGHQPYNSKPMQTHSGKFYTKRVTVKGRGEKSLVLEGRGEFDRVIDFDPTTGLSKGKSYLVPHKDVENIRDARYRCNSCRQAFLM